MKYLLLSLLFLLTSCWKAEEPITIQRPIKTTTVEPLKNYTKEFAAVITTPNYANLAFGVNGTISGILVSSGEKVTKNQVLATLDNTDYKLQLSAENSAYSTAKAALTRAQNMYKKDAISLQELQSTQARYELNRSRWEYAQNQLALCTLKSPMDGFVESTFVTDFQNVTTSEVAMRIIDPRVLEVEFTLPQSDISMSYLTNDFTVEFPTLSPLRFTTKIKEVVDASVDGAGIPVTLSITDKRFDAQKLNVKSGFACTVRVNIEEEYTAHNYTIIPLVAIFSPVGSSQKYVWIYNPMSKSVYRQEVETAGLLGNSMAIVSRGLSTSEEIVTAGVHQIQENQKVRLLQ